MEEESATATCCGGERVVLATVLKMVVMEMNEVGDGVQLVFT